MPIVVEDLAFERPALEVLKLGEDVVVRGVVRRDQPDLMVRRLERDQHLGLGVLVLRINAGMARHGDGSGIAGGPRRWCPDPAKEGYCFVASGDLMDPVTMSSPAKRIMPSPSMTSLSPVSTERP